MKTDRKIIMIPDYFILLRTIDKYPNKSASDMQVLTVITYAHLHKLKKVLNHMGLIEIVREGVRTLLKTTEKGHNAVIKINELLEILNIDESDILDFRRSTKHKFSIETEHSVKKLLKDAKILIEEDMVDE